MSFAKQQKKHYTLLVLTFWLGTSVCEGKKQKTWGKLTPSMNISLQLQTMSAAMLPEAVATRKLCDLCSYCDSLAFSRV